MTTTEHLDLIVKRCKELLAIAENRTQGKWDKRDRDCEAYIFNGFHGRITPDLGNSTSAHDDAQFIAACPENAEAGWRATIAAIEWSQEIDFLENNMIDAILAAWPIELLKQ